jgi:hypothetical protein
VKPNYRRRAAIGLVAVDWKWPSPHHHGVLDRAAADKVAATIISCRPAFLDRCLSLDRVCENQRRSVICRCCKLRWFPNPAASCLGQRFTDLEVSE